MDHIGYGTMKYIRLYHHLFLIHAQNKMLPMTFSVKCWRRLVDHSISSRHLFQWRHVVTIPGGIMQTRQVRKQRAVGKISFRVYRKLWKFRLHAIIVFVICRCDVQHCHAQQYGVMHLFFTVCYKTTDVDYQLNVSKCFVCGCRALGYVCTLTCMKVFRTWCQYCNHCLSYPFWFDLIGCNMMYNWWGYSAITVY